MPTARRFDDGDDRLGDGDGTDGEAEWSNDVMT
jgi:hypothetical protein